MGPDKRMYLQGRKRYERKARLQGRTLMCNCSFAKQLLTTNFMELNNYCLRSKHTIVCDGRIS